MKASYKSFTGLMSLLGLALAVSACEKSGGSESRQVRFSAVSRAESAVGTRTAYSGEFTEVTEGSTTTKYERIDWLGNESNTPDHIRIGMVKSANTPSQSFAGSSEYFISEVNTVGLQSVAKVEPVGEHGLQWGDNEGLYRFMGVYPSSGTIDYDVSVDPVVGTVTGMSIPDRQNVDATRMETETSGTMTNVKYLPNMSNAWMLADVQGVREGADVELQFYPAFTAFEFNILCSDASSSDPVYIRSFTLSSASLDICGSYGATLAVDGGSSFTPPTEGNKSIMVNFDDPVEVSGSKSVTFTLFTLPRDLNDLSISITASRVSQLGTFTRTLALKQGNNFIPFEARKKHRIMAVSMPSGDFRLIFDFQVDEWREATNDPYSYTSPSPGLIRSYDPTYRRFDSSTTPFSDSERSPYPSVAPSTDADWANTAIQVSYGYMNRSGEVVPLDDAALATDVTGQYGGVYRSAYSPIIELNTKGDVSAALRLVLDNPNFKFIKYEFDNGDYVANHGISDTIEIEGNSTYFSVVPAEQFPVDVRLYERLCTVSLLSTAEGTFHVMRFNRSGNLDNVNYYRLPGESESELKFFYVAPADYGTTGDLRAAAGGHQD